MYNHEPENYQCPICIGLQGIESDDTLIRQSDIVYRDDTVTVFIGSFFVGDNPGHPLVVSNGHYENLYDLPEEISHRIIEVSKEVAIALKTARSCAGVTVLQNNEPAGGQHAFHYHMHLFPRFEGDNLHTNMHNSRPSTAEERKPFADRLKELLTK